MLRRSTRVKKPSLQFIESDFYTKFLHLNTTNDAEETSNKTDSSNESNSAVKQTQHSNNNGTKCETVLSSRKTPCTPSKVKREIRKGIAKKLLKTSSSETDDTSTCSEEEDVDDSESDTSESETECNICTTTPNQRRKQLFRKKSTKSAVRYTLKTEAYFTNATLQKKAPTSSRTLDKLDVPRLAQDQVFSLLRHAPILSDAHRQCLDQLRHTNEDDFDKWLLFLHEGFNLLLHGVGSKKSILNDFHERYLSDDHVMVINGFFPSLTMKELQDGLLNLCSIEESVNSYEFCDIIDRSLQDMQQQQQHFYVIVHNIEMMKLPKFYSILAHLFDNNENFHLLASVDHINAPLIWNQYTLTSFKFLWWDCTTFELYTEEAAFETSLMVDQNTALTLSSLRNVFLSLTSNSKRIYLLLVKYNLDVVASKEQKFEGIAFKELYTQCRQQFLVSTDLALRTQLTEFVDHKMVKIKRATDGTEYLLVPIAQNLMQQFLEEYK